MATESGNLGTRSVVASTRPATEQRGASLIFVLMLVLIGGIITISLAAYASSSAKATENFNEVRADRYSGDGAIKTAVNWIKDNPAVAVDPVYAPNANQNCRFEVNGVTVSCNTDEGSGSGVPPEQGSLPPETLLLLGDRHTEPGPYGFSQCNSLWDNVVRFFTGDTPGASEASFTLQKAQRSAGFLNLGSCVDRNRGDGPIQVRGNIVAAGQIRGNSSIRLDAFQGAGAGTVTAKHGCSGVLRSNGTNGLHHVGRESPGLVAGSPVGRHTV